MSQFIDLIAIVLSGFAILFVWWIKDHVRVETSNLKSDLHGEIEVIKMERLKVQSECMARIEAVKELFDDKIADAVGDKFVRTDVYHSDMTGLRAVMDIRFGTLEGKIDKIAAKVGA